MTFTEFINNKIVIGTTIVTIATAVSPVVLLLADSRYVRAETIQQVQSELKKSQQQAVDMVRKEQLEDELFKLRLKENKTRVDEALIQRAQDRLQETNRRLNR